MIFSGWLQAELGSDALIMPKPTFHYTLIDRQREDDIQHKEPDADKLFGRIPTVNLLERLSSWRISLIDSKSES
jgi:hypothetical protein